MGRVKGMTSFDRAFAGLAGLTNWERLRPDAPYRFDLSGMRALLARLGHPERRLAQAVQVGGSKGKGTVAHLTAGIAGRLGLRTGLYTSPHVLDVRERIRLDLAPPPDEILVPHVDAVAAALVPGQTWFEAWTAVATLAFAEARPDLCVLEVGLGGRLDSTTALPRRACALTSIELEHTQVLGDTIEAIAAEKAAVLEAGMGCVTGFEGAALAVLERRAAEVGVRPAVLGRDLGWRLVGREAGGIVVEVRLGDRTRVLSTRLGFAPQGRALCLALGLLATLWPERRDELLDLDLDAPWLEAALPPGRLQLLSREPPIVVDGAHTEDSLTMLADELPRAFPGRRFHLVLAMAEGKRWEAGLGRLAAVVDRAWVAPIVGKPSVVPEVLSAFLEARGVPCEREERVGDAFVAAGAEVLRASRRAGGGPALLLCGSLYAAGEALARRADLGVTVDPGPVRD
ncbi:MAG: hypothetical protein R3F30_05455 [Planctomycetota bacterium]